MSRQIAVLGLSRLGTYIARELKSYDCELLVIDRDKARVELMADDVSASYITDLRAEKSLEKLIPQSVDVVVIDFGTHFESACVVTNRLRKLGFYNIIVRADNDQQADILTAIGATRVIVPHQIAAKRIVPSLVSDSLQNLIQIEENLIILEVQTPDRIVGKTIEEAQIRKSYGLNIIAIKENGVFTHNFDTSYRFQPNQMMVVAGSPREIEEFSGEAVMPSAKPKRFFN